MGTLRWGMWRWAAAGTVVVLLGVFSSVAAGMVAGTFVRSELLARAETVAAMVGETDLSRLTGTDADLGTPEYERLKEKVSQVRALDSGTRFVYLMGYRNGSLFIFMDSEPAGLEDYSPPGDPYPDASRAKLANFLSGKNFTEGPYADRWGEWVSGYASVDSFRGADGVPVAMVGVDMSAAAYRQAVFFAQALPSVVTSLMLLLVFALYRGRTAEARFLYEQVTGRERLRVILESLPVGVVVIRASDGKAEIMNRMAIQIFGRSFDPNIGPGEVPSRYRIEHEDGSLFRFEDLPPGKTLRTGKPVRAVDVYVRHPDGTRLNTRGFSVPVKDTNGALESVVLVIEDVTKEREIDRMKTEFVSLASHQLQTPLTQIKWVTESLLDRADCTGKVQRDSLRQIASSCARLIALVQDLLSVSRIETGRKFSLTKKPTDLSSLIDAVLSESSWPAKQHGVTVVRDPKLPKRLMASVDVEKIRQVLANLVGNAIKYSKKGGAVTVGQAPSRPGRITLAVRDQGIGIPAAQHARVFDKFFRADNVRKVDVSGTGLGLYIAKGFVEKHGGRIWFDSKEGVGTTFFVELPRA